MYDEVVSKAIEDSRKIPDRTVVDFGKIYVPELFVIVFRFAAKVIRKIRR